MGRVKTGTPVAKDIHDVFKQQDGSFYEVSGTDQKREWSLVVPCAKPDEYISRQKYSHLPPEERKKYYVCNPDLLHDPDIDFSKAYAVKARTFFILPRLVEGMKVGNGKYYNYAYILHDKDTVTEEYYKKLNSEDRKRYILLPETETEGYPFVRSPQKYALKRLHYHVVLMMEQYMTWSKIRNYFGSDIHLEYVQNLYSSFLYLTHETRDALRRGKYRYDKSEVVSNNFLAFERLVRTSLVFEHFDPNLIGKYFFVDGCRNALDIFARFGVVQTQRYLQSINTFALLKKEIVEKEGMYRYALWDPDQGLRFVEEESLYSDGDVLSASSVKLLNNVRFSEYGEYYVYYKLLCTEELTFVENLVAFNTHHDWVEQFDIKLSPWGYSVFESAGRLRTMEFFDINTGKNLNVI